MNQDYTQEVFRCRLAGRVVRKPKQTRGLLSSDLTCSYSLHSERMYGTQTVAGLYL